MNIHVPLTVFWSVTRRCNLDCVFCLTEGGDPAPGESPDIRARLAHVLSDASVLKVVVTGGEPTVIPDLLELIEILKKGGCFVEITTNGTSLDSKSSESCHL